MAAFEKGKPGAELGLALKALQALGLSLNIEPNRDTSVEQKSAEKGAALAHTAGDASLEHVIAHATLRNVARSSVAGWPTATATQGKSTNTTAKPKRKA